MKNYLVPAAAVVLLLFLQTIPYKKLTWQTREASPEQKEFARRLGNVPFEVGDWQSDATNVDQRELEASAATGSYSRVFRNRYDPEKKIDVFIVCGHPQDVTIHTPDRCYKASGFKEDDEARKFPIDYGKEYGKSVGWFWTNRFKAGNEAEGQQSLRIFWSFSDDGEWVAPNFARLTLGRSPAVFKIYAINVLKPGQREQPEESPCKDFLRDFIPLMNAALFPPPVGSETPSAAPPDEKNAVKAGITHEGNADSRDKAAAKENAATKENVAPKKGQ